MINSVFGGARVSAADFVLGTDKATMQSLFPKYNRPVRSRTRQAKHFILLLANRAESLSMQRGFVFFVSSENVSVIQFPEKIDLQRNNKKINESERKYMLIQVK